jgi:V/A-type H+-transporting ATPase subunit I
MLRPERMSKATLFFLKSDAERVIDILNDQGAFHLAFKELERLSSSDLCDRIQNLLNRLREVINKINALVGQGPSAQVQLQEALVIEANDWPSFINTMEGEISSYERNLKELEVALQAEAKIKPIFSLWKAFAAGVLGRESLECISPLKRLGAVVLYTQNVRPIKLEGVLPTASLKFQISSEPYIVLVLCMLGDTEKVIHAAEDVGYSVPVPLEGMPQDYASLPGFLNSYEESLGKSALANAELKRSLEGLVPRLLYLSSTLSDAHSVLSIKERASMVEKLAVLEGYVPSNKVGSLVGELTGKLNGRLVSFFQEERSSPKVPVMYRYPKFMKLFESLTTLYGTPSYNEINPTPILALTFPLFFGLMFGDLGHGIILATIGVFLYKYSKSMAKIGTILVVCGLFGAIIGGVLYGEAFGRPIGYHTIFSPSEDLMGTFMFAIFIGVAQISLGIIVAIGNSLIQRKKEDAFFVNLPKLLLYIISIYVIFHYGLDFNVWFSGPIFFILAPMIVLLIGKPLYTIVKHGRKGIAVFGETGFEVLHTTISFISNTASYLRIWAMITAHVLLSSVFYVLAAIGSGGQFGFIFYGLMVAVGSIFVVGMEGIVVLAQDMRLHFYEWFSRFYEDSGVRFMPFKLSLGVPILKK